MEENEYALTSGIFENEAVRHKSQNKEDAINGGGDIKQTLKTLVSICCHESGNTIWREVTDKVTKQSSHTSFPPVKCQLFP